MGIVFGVILGLVASLVVVYLLIRNIIVGNRRFVYVSLLMLVLLSLVALYISQNDTNTNLIYSFGWAPFYLFFVPFLSMGLPAGASIFLGIAAFSLPFILAYFLPKKSIAEIPQSNSNRTHYVHLFELVIAGTALVLTLIIGWKFWFSSGQINPAPLRQSSTESPAQQIQTNNQSIDERISNATTATPCNQTALYGFPYYIAPNTGIGCYKTYELKEADINTLTPLERISTSTAQQLLPNVLIEQEFNFAFDKNNFYIDGDITYSVEKGTFRLINMPRMGQEGGVMVNGKEYTVVMTGLIGANLK